jgi:uncharacterized protein YmfQ (DUF2313 family)
MPFSRIVKHLLPRGKAWRLPKGGPLRALFDGVAESPEAAREFVDEVWGDLLPDSTRELEKWERQFGLSGVGDDATRRQVLAAAWKATGGQSPRYLQDAMQAAGFPVYVHEWWESGPDPWVARDPRDYTTQPLIGTVQCDSVTATQPQCSAFATQPQCDNFLANEPGYIVNLNLTSAAPPPVPSDSDRWPYFLYWGAETFPGTAFVDEARRREFERLLLRLNPAQQWLVTRVRYEEDPPPEVLHNAALFLRSDFGIQQDGSDNAETWDPVTALFLGEAAEQATAGLRPGFTNSNATFNGHPSIDPDATDDRMVLAHHSSLSMTSSGFYVMAVIASDSERDQSEYVISKFRLGDGKAEWSAHIDNGRPRMLVRNATNTAAGGPLWGTDIRNGQPRIVEWYHDGDETAGLCVDGASDVTQTGRTFRQDDGPLDVFGALGGNGGPDLSTSVIAVLPFMPTGEQRAQIRAWAQRYIP